MTDWHFFYTTFPAVTNGTISVKSKSKNKKNNILWQKIFNLT
jgi:hypothetical protein